MFFNLLFLFAFGLGENLRWKICLVAGEVMKVMNQVLFGYCFFKLFLRAVFENPDNTIFMFWI